MTRQEQFEYVVNHWYLKDGIVYAYKTQKPVFFSGVNDTNHRFKTVKYKGATAAVYIHQAVYILHHNRPIGDGMVIHHIDGNPLNNHPSNLIELTRKQHVRIHAYQCDDPLFGIDLSHGAWRFIWHDADGRQHCKRFHGINEAMKFREMIEEPFRAELRALGLDC